MLAEEIALNKEIKGLKKKKQKLISQTSRPRKKTTLLVLAICMGCLFSFNLGTRFVFRENISGTMEWRTTNSQQYLFIEADDSYSLGYLTGKALWREIIALKSLLITMAPIYQSSYHELKQMAAEYLKYIPEDLIEEMKGLGRGTSFGSGIYISFEDILVQNIWYDVFYGRILPKSLGPLGCTAIGAINKDNTTIFGQNFDLNPPFQKTLRFVLHRVGDKPAIFGLRLGASLNLPMAKTELNITTLITLVQTNIFANISQPVLVRTRLALQNSTSAEEFYQNFYSHDKYSNNCGFNLIITDPNEIIATETNPYGTICWKGMALCKTNTYTDPLWQGYLMNSTYSKERQNYVEEYINEQFSDGNLSELELLNLLKTSPLICQKSPNQKGSSTLAYLTSTYFGLGNLRESQPGQLPL